MRDNASFIYNHAGVMEGRLRELGMEMERFHQENRWNPPSANRGNLQGRIESASPSDAVRNFRSLFLKQIGVGLPGLSVLRLRIHKHLSEVDSVETHSHRFAQILCYLSKGGELVVGRIAHTVESGTLAFIPAGCRHAFREHPGRRPVCLAIDLRLSQAKTPKVSALSHSESAKIRRELSKLGRLRDPDSMESRFLAASSALSILDTAFRSLGLLPHEAPPVPGVVRRLESLASDPRFFDVATGELCRKVGGNQDYLNRLFKRHTGVTLQRHRDATRLELSKNELMKGAPIGRAAEASGFSDSNYFSRWFRQQTGLTPSAFVKSSIRPPKPA